MNATTTTNNNNNNTNTNNTNTNATDNTTHHTSSTTTTTNHNHHNHNTNDNNNLHGLAGTGEGRLVLPRHPHGQPPDFFRSSETWRLRMWCLIIIDVTLSYAYILPNIGSHTYCYQTPNPQTPHP